MLAWPFANLAGVKILNEASFCRLVFVQPNAVIYCVCVDSSVHSGANCDPGPGQRHQNSAYAGSCVSKRDLI